MTKLIYITNSRIPTEKAHGFQVMKMCEAFSNAGIEVDLWIPKRFNRIKESPFDYYGIKQVFKITKIPVIDLIPLEKIFGRLANFVGSFSFAILSLIKLPNEEAIIYSRDQFISWFLSFGNRRLVYEIHSFPKRYYLYGRIWKKAHKIIAITEGLKNLLIKNGIEADKILVAPDAVDLAAFGVVSDDREELRTELGLPANNFLIGYVGRFRTLGMEKGIKTMIEALPLIDKETKMVFVGGEETEIKDYRALANRFNVVVQCIFVGYESRAEAIKYMKAADVLVIPFPNKPHYAFYASPLKLFEYMASGRPIISSDLPALKEILNDKNALFFKPEKATDLARAVKMLKSSQTLGYHLSRQALADVKEHTWASRVKNILDFIMKDN